MTNQLEICKAFEILEQEMIKRIISYAKKGDTSGIVEYNRALYELCQIEVTVFKYKSGLDKVKK